MIYGDGTEVQLGDTVEENDSPEEFEPEEGVVIAIGKTKIQIELINENIKNRKVWVAPHLCELIAREA